MVVGGLGYLLEGQVLVGDLMLVGLVENLLCFGFALGWSWGWGFQSGDLEIGSEAGAECIEAE